MLEKKHYLKILAERPDVFSALPPDLLDEHAAEQLRHIPRLAAAELSHPADVQAIYQVLTSRRPDGLLPTISYTGTEYGSWAALDKAAAELKRTVEKELRIFVAPPLLLGSPPLWQAIRQAHEDVFSKHLDISGRCLGCRLYNYMLRIPACKRLDAGFFIPSLRGLAQRGCTSHNVPAVIKYLSFLMAGYGIEVWYQAAPETGRTDASDLSCVLGAEPEVKASPDKLARYFERFILPAAGGILSRAVFGLQVDYESCFKEIIHPLKSTPAKIDR